MASRRQAVHIVTIVAGVGIALLASEGFCRWLDGDAIFALQLRATPHRPTERSARPLTDLARHYASGLPAAAGVQFAWYDDDPKPIRPRPLPEWARERVASHPDSGDVALYEFNRAFLQDRLCRHLDADQFGNLEEFLYFDAVGSDIYPSYRLPPNITTPGGLTTNRFGWRGPDVDVARPPETVRVAFVGSSTTVNDEGFPFSYPEFIGHWLNLWAAAHSWPARFEIVNAARSGINSHSIAAIVRDEVRRVDPDLVVYYEGANQFWPPDALAYRLGRLFPRPMTDGALAPSSHRSALVVRARRLFEAWRGGDGREPPKPPQWLKLEGVNETVPDPDDAHLPVELPAIVHDLDAIGQTLASTRAELVVSSFVWMVQDGLRLELPRQVGLFTYLNGYWPASYQNIRRLADLQNRVLANYAQARHRPFIDVAGQLPMDANLFADAIHMRYPGVRLHAWIVFQALARLLEPSLRAGTLPRAASTSVMSRPLAESIPKTVTRREILSDCR